jgi:hypothetical protein
MLESGSAVGDVVKNGAGNYQREEAAPCEYPQTLCRQVHQNSLAQPSSFSRNKASAFHPSDLTSKIHFRWEDWSGVRPGDMGWNCGSASAAL